MSKFIPLIALFMVVFFFHPPARHIETAISCKADVSYHWQKNRLNLLISQNLHGGKGNISLSGILYDQDKVKAYLSKTISFSYRQNRNFYYFQSELIMESPQMTMSLADQKRWFPDFFINADRPMLLKIRPYGKSAWLFYSENTPLFVCEKSE